MSRRKVVPFPKPPGAMVTISLVYGRPPEPPKERRGENVVDIKERLDKRP